MTSTLKSINFENFIYRSHDFICLESELIRLNILDTKSCTKKKKVL